jgi:hypothetical protein
MAGRDIQVAWAAGFLDGEGYFGASRRDDSYKPEVTAAQVRREPLERLVDLFGGHICEVKSRREGQRRYWRWSVGGARAVREVLAEVGPHLTTKEREAELLLELCGLIPRQGRVMVMEPGVSERRHRIVQELKDVRRAESSLV